MMTNKPRYYRIYLLIVWQEQSRGPPASVTWRSRLENPRTGWHRAFADVAPLMTALQEITLSTQGEAEKPISTTKSRTFIQQYWEALSSTAKPVFFVVREVKTPNALPQCVN